VIFSTIGVDEDLHFPRQRCSLTHGSTFLVRLLREPRAARRRHGKLQEGSEAALTTGSELWRPYFLALRAQAAGAAGQPEDGRRLLAEAQEVMARTDERFYEAELSRLTGVLHLAHSPAARAEAEAHMCHALEVARHQEAKSLELRAAVSLCRLWQQEGKRIEARELLAPLYGWFTEGFDTADLQEARALLEELS
jgi:predicted ATPase